MPLYACWQLCNDDDGDGWKLILGLSVIAMPRRNWILKWKLVARRWRGQSRNQFPFPWPKIVTGERRTCRPINPKIYPKKLICINWQHFDSFAPSASYHLFTGSQKACQFSCYFPAEGIEPNWQHRVQPLSRLVWYTFFRPCSKAGTCLSAMLTWISLVIFTASFWQLGCVISVVIPEFGFCVQTLSRTEAGKNVSARASELSV